MYTTYGISDTAINKFKHVPVMAQEIIDHIVKPEAQLYLDCTVGLGGHASMILESSPNSRLIGIDIDPQAITIAAENLKPYKDRVILLNGNFADLDYIMKQLRVDENFDGIIMDLGVSSIQLDIPERGFSFRSDGPLDMRMDQTKGDPVYHDLEKLSIRDLETIIREFGEERFARRIATNIINTNKVSPIKTTTQLAEIIERSKPKYTENIHSATRTFQALRIYKNQELSNLEVGLEKAISLLKSGGRIGVISFHSLEDRIVKHTFQKYERGCECPSEFPKCICGKKPSLKIITKHPITPKGEEVSANPRSRSAKLRIAEKI